MIAVRHAEPARVAGLLVALALALTAALGIARPVLGVETLLFAELTGAEEVPGPGDPDGTGTADILIDPETETLCVSLVVEGIAAATAAHIHVGAAGVAGGVVVTLPTPDAGGFANDCVTVDAALAQAIVDDPAGYYVNVHTADFPDGAVRGQLGPPPPTAFAFLTGNDEVPGPGDPDGVGNVILTFDTDADEICASMFIEGIAPATAAHIHQGAAGVAGPVVVTLPTPDADGFAEGCVAVDGALIDAILADLAGYYVNVHNAEFPDGAVRGQLTGELPGGDCILLGSTEDDPTPSSTLTVTVGEEVVLLGVFQPDAEVVLTLERDGSVESTQTLTADATGFIIAVVVPEDGDEGSWTATAVIPETECAGTVTFVVLGDGTPPTASPSSPTPSGALPDTRADSGSGASPSPWALALLLAASVFATVTVRYRRARRG